MGYDIATIREVYYVLAAGGYLAPAQIERIQFSTEDTEFNDQEETFNEYVTRKLADVRNKHEQGFSQSFVVKEADLPVWASIINVEVNRIPTGNQIGRAHV